MDSSEDSNHIVTEYEWRKIDLRSLLIPSMRCHSAAALVGGNIWLIGGRGVGQFNEVWCFSLQERMWERITYTGEYPSPRDGHTATGIGNNEIIVFGGQGLCKPPESDRADRYSENQKIKALFQREVYNDLYLFQCDTKRWSLLVRKSRCPTGRRGHSTIFIPPPPEQVRVPSRHQKARVNFKPVEGLLESNTKGLLVVYGGACIESAWGMEQLSNELWVYNVSTCIWTLQKSRGAHPPPMYEHAAVYTNEQIIISGGIIAPHRVDPEESTKRVGKYSIA